ncbi:hypothetical protein FOL47_006118 [Perkinsus chesapeaki]|uniref:Major facilitator superfamily (MFS) profile domain-containing protein n=1 Tax=Perkinsus chesapeaki TaxID=330153 RepID=A0A7J6MZ55_PERCH|nr:hypothetical protein FOL47_006118 [Perkinsus chesapeaki]
MVLLVVPLSTLFVSLDPSPCPSSEALHPPFARVNAIGLTLALLQLLNFFLGLPKLISLALVVVLFTIMVALPLTAAKRHLATPLGYTSVVPTRADTHQGFYYTGNTPLKSPLFWFAFVGLSAAFGGGLAFMNNQAQLLPPEIPDRPRTVGALLTVVTASSAASRVIIGWAADRVKVLTRPGYIVILITTMIVAFLILSNSPSAPATLFICGPLIGFCFGGLWSLTPPLCADLFGDHNLPLVYSSMRGTLLVGALLIASATMSVFYTPAYRYSRSFGAVAVVLTVAGLLPWLAIALKTRAWYSS